MSAQSYAQRPAAVDRAARSFGVRVPDNLWVIGFDDIAMAAWESFDLTSVRQRGSTDHPPA